MDIQTLLCQYFSFAWEKSNVMLNSIYQNLRDYEISFSKEAMEEYTVCPVSETVESIYTLKLNPRELCVLVPFSLCLLIHLNFVVCFLSSKHLFPIPPRETLNLHNYHYQHFFINNKSWKEMLTHSSLQLPLLQLYMMYKSLCLEIERERETEN